MHDLVSMTPLGASKALTETIGAVKIREVTDLALASVETRIGGAEKLAKAAKLVLGAALPGPGHSSAKSAIYAYWIAQDKWLFSALSSAHEHLASELTDKFGRAASVTEQTDGWACFSVEGDDLSELLMRLFQIDVPSAKQGSVHRTMAEHVAVILVCDDPRKAIRIFCARSYAGHLHHVLVAMARSVAD
jgi:sarcosine oxidase subunit gamma